MTIFARRPAAGSGRIAVMAALRSDNGPIKLFWNRDSHASGSGSASAVGGGWGGISTAPSRTMARLERHSAKRATEASSVISTLTASARPAPASRALAATASRRERSRAARTREYPVRARRSQTAAPIPPDAPVTRMVFAASGMPANPQRLPAPSPHATKRDGRKKPACAGSRIIRGKPRGRRRRPAWSPPCRHRAPRRSRRVAAGPCAGAPERRPRR